LTSVIMRWEAGAAARVTCCRIAERGFSCEIGRGESIGTN
jgi:hypothetical protein